MKITTAVPIALTLLALSACPRPPVELSSLSLSPESARLAQGESLQFVATAVYTDGEVADVTAQALWSVDDAFVGAASPETRGLVEARGEGLTVVRLRFGGKTVTRTLTVISAELRELQLDPPHPVLPVGLGMALTVTALRSDGSKKDVTAEAIWSSSSPAAATVEQSTLWGHAPGALTITASVQGLAVTAPVDVTDATVETVDVQPSVFTLPLGVTRQLTATALLSDGTSLDVTRQAAWLSNTPQVAFPSTLPGEAGLIGGRGQGAAKLTATVAGKTGHSLVTVTPAVLRSLELGPSVSALAHGTSQRFTATGTFSDGTVADLSSQVSWSSSNEAVFTAAAGLVRTIGVGTAQLAATFGVTRASRELQVTSAALTAIDLQPGPAVVARGLTLEVTAIGTFTDGTHQDLTRLVIWRVADASVADVSNAPGTAGRVTSRQEGVTLLSAALAGLTARTTLTVTAAQLLSVQITPPAPTMARGTVLAFTASGLFSDGTTQDLTGQATWTSSDPTRVAISSQGPSRGVGSAISQGTAELHAVVAGKVGRSTVTVSDAVLTELEITPALASLPLGVTTRFAATGRFSDHSTADLTSQVTWSSAAPAIASISNAPGTTGEVRALALGQALLTAQFGAVTATATVTVSSATLTALELSPAAATLAVGLTRDFTAIGTYSDGTSVDLTDQALFSIAAPALATVSAGAQFARVMGQAAGSTQVVATAGGLTARADLVITPARLTGLTLSATSLTLARGTRGQLSVEATWSDGTTADVTTQASWSSTDPTVVTVSTAAGSEGLLTALDLGTAVVRAQLGTLAAISTITVSPAVLTAIELTPTAAVVPLGARQAFVATGRYSDGSAQDLTTQATWTSSANLVLGVSNAAGLAGEATALAQGTAVLSATFAGTVGRTTVVVTGATLSRIEFSPPAPRLAKQTRISLRATGVWTDGATQELTDTCTWSSATPAVATVSNAVGTQGRVSALAPGLVRIGATCSGVSGSVDLTVTNAALLDIELTPTAPTAAAGFTLALTATGRFSDGSTQPFSDFVSWSSADGAIATVGQDGLVSARAQGAVLISAQALGVTGTVSFGVSAALLEGLELAPAPASVPKGLAQAFVALGHFSDGTRADVTEAATWTSSDTAVASISNAAGTRGLATALSEGVTTVSALLSGFGASTTLTVTPATLSTLTVTPVTPSLARGLSLQFTATGTFTDGTTRELTSQVTWSAGDGAVASLSNTDGSRGRALALSVGLTHVTATLGTVVGQSTLTVTSAALTSLGVTPVNPAVPLGLTRQLAAIGVYTDGSTADLTAAVTWTSGEPGAATVSNGVGDHGLVQAVATGVAVITATQGSFAGTTTITVTPAVLQQLSLTPPAPSLPAGLTIPVVATGLYSDASTLDVTSSVSWSSVDPSIAVASGGVLRGLRVGTTTLTATVGSISAPLTVSITAALLQQLQVTPQNVSRPRGLTQQFTATGVFSDASVVDLTGSVTWSTSDETKVLVSNAAGSRGLGSTPALGAVTVSATLSGITGSTPFTVTSAALTRLAITPAGSTASLGSVRQYAATGTYTDASTQNLTSQVAWASSNPGVATVSNAGGSNGLATTLSTGVTSISAHFGGFSASANLLIIQNALTRIDLTPAAGGTALGYSRQFIAIGSYSDGTTQVLTGLATWTTDDAAVAIVSNADGSRGLLSTVGVGSVNVSATWQGVSATSTHLVNPAVLLVLSVDPGALSLGVAGTGQLSATGYFSDGSMQDLTAVVTWTSDAPGVVQVSNAAGSQGLATGISAGNASIAASLGAENASVVVTVN